VILPPGKQAVAGFSAAVGVLANTADWGMTARACARKSTTGIFDE